MLTLKSIVGSNQYAAANYFSEADDYYSKEEPGQWQGLGAQALGLTGPVDVRAFSRLLDGQLPNGDTIARTFPGEKDKRMALDLTFSAPKSVSMQALIAGDKDVVAAHDRAVKVALEQAEKLAMTRKKVKGKSRVERTGKLVIAKFRHELSRAKDPQLHTHGVVLNMTVRADGAWRALVNDDFFRVQHEIDGVYKAELARGLQALGYAIRVVDDRGNFELDHISRDQIEAFSARGLVIEEALANQGKTRATATSLEKQVIALATRPAKEPADASVIRRYWIEKSSDLGIDFGPRSRLTDYTPKAASGRGNGDGTREPPDPRALAALSLPSGMTPAQAVVQFAINHLTEREAVVKETSLFAAALHRAVGLAGPEDVRREIDRLVQQGSLIARAPTYQSAGDKDSPELSAAGWSAFLMQRKGWSARMAREYVRNAVEFGSLVPAERQFTTLKALKREKAILAMERDGRGQVAMLLDAAVVRQALARRTLTPGQHSAVEAIVSTNNRFVGIQGDAGTGKTYAVMQAVALIEMANAHRTGELSRPDRPPQPLVARLKAWPAALLGMRAGALADMRPEDPTSARSGMPYRTIALAPYGNQVKALKEEGLDAHTLASFLATRNKLIDARTVVLLDEAGVVPARQMEQLMRVVEKAGARMVMLGDTKQTEAIEAGKPFAQLQEHGMHTARITEVQRQQNAELRLSVELAAQGKVVESLQHVGPVEAVADATRRHASIVGHYMLLAPEERDRAIIVAGTNGARREINTMVRQAMDLAGRGSEFDTLLRVDMTQAQRRYAPSYSPGTVIQPEMDYLKVGLQRGETYVVKEALPGNVLVLRSRDGSERSINPRKIAKLSVYRMEKAELSVGDTVRVNRNFAKEDLTNGDRFRVASVIGGLVRLESVLHRDGHPVRTVEMLGSKPLHLEHAYSSTTHSAQGLTRDQAFISIDTKSRTTSMNLYYVAISRAREAARVYTNDAEALPKAISRRYEKSTALELQKGR